MTLADNTKCWSTGLKNWLDARCWFDVRLFVCPFVHLSALEKIGTDYSCSIRALTRRNELAASLAMST
jgi:hypothetical protein